MQEIQVRTILESTGDGILAVDNAGKVIKANQKFLDLWEIPPALLREGDDDVLLTYILSQLVDSDKFLEKVKQLYGSTAVDFDAILFKDGRIMERYSCPLLSEGVVNGRVWSFRDITERRKAEEALKESRSKYQFLAESMADVVFTLDMNLATSYVSPSIEKMLGYTPEERMAQKVDQQLTAGSQQVVFETLAAELSREKEKGRDPDRSKAMELEYYHKDGSIRHLATYIRGIRNGEGTLMGFFGSHHDITSRKHAEEALRGSEKKFFMTFQANPSLMAIRSLKDGRFIDVNDAYTRVTGFNREELIGADSRELNITDSETVENVREIFSKEGCISNWEGKFRTKTGDIRTGLFSGVAIEIGNEPCILSALQDITDRKRTEEEKRGLEERLRHAEKMEALGQLAGGVAHDLNNVLGILSGYSELLLEEIPEESISRGHVEKIFRSTEKGAAIVQDLLTLARRGVVVSDVMNLNGIVSAFLKTPVFEKMKDYHPRVTFRTECDNNLLNLKGSPVHMEKVLMNLISNAAEAISGEGEVKIRTENRHLDKPIRGYDEVKEGDYAVLIVSDTGMGIPIEHMQKIFEPFFTKKTMGRSGTGLGLAIVWGTVKDHDGYVDVHTKVGVGTTFMLYFPATREELTAQPRKAPIEQCMGKGESVLVVDDIADQRDVASSLLTRLGYEVHVVSSGEEAVEYLKGNQADILVLDMIMTPGIDGLETYRRVLEINPKQKAILVSGFSQTERLKEAQKLGAGAYVKKPYVMEKIGVAIREELNRK